MVKSISVLGCTGSIGRQTIAVAEHIGMKVTALTANRRIDMLEEQARRLHPSFVAVYDKAAARRFRIAIADTDIKVGSGIEGLIEAATMAETDCVVTAVSGSVGLKPTLAAIDARKRIALANKETLVTAGHLIMPLAKKHGVSIVIESVAVDLLLKGDDLLRRSEHGHNNINQMGTEIKNSPAPVSGKPLAERLAIAGAAHGGVDLENLSEPPFSGRFDAELNGGIAAEHVGHLQNHILFFALCCLFKTFSIPKRKTICT